MTVSALAGLPRSVVEPRAPTWERRRGEAFAWAVRLAFRLVWLLTSLVLGVGLLVGARVVLVVMLASWHTSADGRRSDWTAISRRSPWSCPAYNESVGIAAAVRSLAAQRLPRPRDRRRRRRLHRRHGRDRSRRSACRGVRVVRQANGGKAGRAERRHRGHDRDGRRHGRRRHGVRARHRPPRSCSRSRTIASARSPGNTKVGNRGGLLGRWQHIEYVIGFNLDRRMYEVLAMHADRARRDRRVPAQTSSPRSAASRRHARRGHRPHNRDRPAGRRVVYADDARAWTEAPATLGGLWRQRYRWSLRHDAGGLEAQAVRCSARDPRQGRIGRRALPYMLLLPDPPADSSRR